jgi:glycosyltransferase involved in cell wall biosynthesis
MCILNKNKIVLFSIVIPSFNRAHILPQAISSVLNQTYTNWELIVVDDGSTDATSTIVAGYDDKRIQYHKN